MLRRGLPWVMLVGAVVLFAIYSFPGFMSADSAEQLFQARANRYTDWHPPLMAVMWHYADKIIAGPVLMWLAQGLGFLVGTILILRSRLSLRRSVVVASLIFVSPPMLSQLAVVWKDCQMAAFFVLGAGLLALRKPRWTVVGCILLAIATAERVNAPAASLPLVLGMFQWKAAWSRSRNAVVGFGVWVVIVLAGLGVNRAFTDEETHPWHSSLALFDIVGTLRWQGGASDAELRRILDGIPNTPHDQIRHRFVQVYTPVVWWQLSHAETAVIGTPVTPEQRAAVSRAWRESIARFPRAYVRHRGLVIRNLLGLIDDVPMGAVWRVRGAPESLLPLKLDPHSPASQTALGDAMESVQDTLPFRAWLYFAISLALLWFARRDTLVFSLVASGVLYECTLFIAAPSSDFRYSHWMIATSIIAAILFFTSRWRMGRRKDRLARDQRISQPWGPDSTPRRPPPRDGYVIPSP